MKLWRCDVCQSLIDPVEGQDRYSLKVAYMGEREDVDLCETCRPEAFGSFIDWLIHSMEDR